MRAGLFIRRLVTVTILFLFVSLSDSAFAADWTLTAENTQGLIAIPADPLGSSNFFDVTKMTPGDNERAAVKVKNNCTFPFSLTVEVLSLSELPDLAEQLVIEVYRDGTLLDSFPGIGKYTFEEKFGSNTETVLDFSVSLPGASTDNRFQSSEAVLQWIFTADGSGENKKNSSYSGGSSRSTSVTPVQEMFTLVDPLIPLDAFAAYEMPKTGEEPLGYSIATGLAILLLGVFLLRKEKKRAQQL